MLKKVLAVVLFAALLLTMVPAVGAVGQTEVEERATDVEVVGLGNFGNANVAIAPNGGYIGAMVPVDPLTALSTSNTLFIKGQYADVVDKTFTLAIVFNGTLDPEVDAVAVNYSWMDLSDEKHFVTLADGRSVIWHNFQVQNWTRVLQNDEDAGSSMDYKVTVVKDGGVSFSTEFKVEFIDEAYDPEDLLVGYSLDMYNILNTYGLKPDDQLVPGDVVTLPAVGSEYTVNVSSNLNVRATPAGAVVAKLGNGAKVFVVGYTDKWAEILYGDGTAFVYTDFIG